MPRPGGRELQRHGCAEYAGEHAAPVRPDDSEIRRDRFPGQHVDGLSSQQHHLDFRPGSKFAEPASGMTERSHRLESL